MTPTPEARCNCSAFGHNAYCMVHPRDTGRAPRLDLDALEALAGRLAKAMLATMPAVTPEGMARFLLSEGTVLTTVDDVARRLSESRRRHPWPWDELPEHVRDDYRAEARRLLGVTEE